MGDATRQPGALPAQIAADTGVAPALVMLGVAALLRWVWRLPIPLSVFGVGLAVFACDVAMSRLRPRLAHPRRGRLDLLHCLFDITAITFILGQAGGGDWVGAFFYLFLILHANMLFTRPRALLLTGLCIGAYSALMLLNYWDLLPPVTLFPGQRALAADRGYVVAVILVLGVGGLLTFGFTFGAFADALRLKADQLRDANAQLQAAAARLRRHRDQLERTVARRTHDLRTALAHLRSAHEQLKRQDQLKTDFLASVSHELRTPLTSIRSFAEILLQFPDEEPRSREEFLEIIAAEAQRLERLIEEVLDISRIESGRMEWHFSSVELPALLSFCVRSVTPLAQRKRLELRLNLPPDLPPVRADRDRVAQVLNNLLANALKFTESGRITVSAVPCSDQVRISVADQGPGIPAAEREHIFDKFHQVARGLARPPGSGLGLAICAEIVAAHGGRIWVDSTPGQGSIFHFTLPIDGAQLPPPPRQSHRPLVLIADPEPGARAQHRQALQQAGYEVREAANARQALHLAAVCAPDLICLDVLLPDTSGFDVLRALRASADTRTIPVIIMSVMEDKEWALRLGAACHLAKPVAGAEIAAAAAEVLTASRPRSVECARDGSGRSAAATGPA